MKLPGFLRLSRTGFSARPLAVPALIVSLVFAGLLALRAAPPLVNTAIGNQAKATYTDDSNVVREVFSNTVVTRVTQIYALDLAQDNTRLATPGSQVFFPHAVTNLGNGNDTIDLAAVTSGTVGLTGLAIYADSNQDGLPDNFDAIDQLSEMPNLAPGGTFHFVVVGIVPPSATAAQTGGATVTATSRGSSSVTDTNLDSFTVTNNAVMQVNKSVSIASGVPGFTPVRYTITYTNTGNSAATDFTLVDDIPAGLVYVAGSARWSVSGSTALDDDTGANDPAGIDYNYAAVVAGRATFVVANVNPGQSGFVTFEVSVAANQPPGVLNNRADYSFTTGGDPAGPFYSNIVPFTVLPVADVDLDGDNAPKDNAGNTLVDATAPAGSIVVFTNPLTNEGNGTDTFDITLSGSNFPAGTTFQLFQSDGNTPMTDTNGNGIPDTGPIAAGVSYDVILKANLPGNSPDGAGPYQVTKTARSTVDPTVTDTGVDILAAITGAKVDLTNGVTAGATGSNGANYPGTGANDGTVIRTNTTNPGTTTTFTLVVTNTGPEPDSFNLLADDDGAFGNVSDLPAGWTVVFKDGSTVVSNTGVIASLGSKTITAEVFVPAGTSPGDRDLYFRSRSPVTLASDIVRDVVSVNTVRELSVQTDNVGQTFPGGSVVYTHTLTNNGNVTEGNAGPSVVTLAHIDTLTASGFTSVVHYDTNANGILDAADPVIVGNLAAVKAAGLAPGEAVKIFVKVFAPLGAADGAANATTLTVTTTGGAINSVAVPAQVLNVDTTNVVRGDLSIVKEQAVDANADGDLADAGDSAYTINQLSGPPGSVIYYRITVTNTGSLDATGITVNDTVPAYTTYYVGTGPTSAGATITGDGTSLGVATEPGNGAASPAPLLFNIGTLTPTQSTVITFSVRIDQ